ncbi:oligosaccharide flippase family protein [Pontibacter oryzae]|uniref:Lipopolysaccharide biosynthesis protein n=1 Tax=Pontibacter oryzae TaxID=2304593 RepID=A0A399SHM9_9BACT|nr:oligosaccharide flippase family protein [Pontibacter oryzae]RIJ42524.1 hypothetical protein D1627_01275 [Pontibacter oryzae]
MKLINKFFRNPHLMSLAGNLAASGMGFLSFALLARVLPPQDLGQWVMLVTCFGVFELLRSGLVQTALTKYTGGVAMEVALPYYGAAWSLASMVTILLVVLATGAMLSFSSLAALESLVFYSKWLALVALATLPMQVALWVQQVISRFDRILIMRLVSSGLFLLMIISSAASPWALLPTIAGAFALAQLVAGLLALALGWAELRSIFSVQRASFWEMLHFGKYSMGTMLGSNLLRSSDTLLIGLFMPAQWVALYNVPQKLLEIVEIPVRSVLATALPRLAASHATGNQEDVARIWSMYLGRLALLVLPLALICFIWAEKLVTLVGGPEYVASATILRILSVYAALLPLDRLAGVGLDVVGRPALNFVKVILMLSVNVLGDLVAIRFENLELVAATSILTFATGVFFGNMILQRYLPVSAWQALLQAAGDVAGLGRRLWALAYPKS